MTFLAVRMRSRKTLGLAIRVLRNQRNRWVLSLAFFSSSIALANPVLSILTQTQRLDAALVEEFEASRKVSVRVEFVSSSLDYEARIRSLPHNWDLVLAEEQRLVNLSFTKILRQLPETIVLPRDLGGLERRARANLDGRSYLNLMADPLGIMYLKNTLTSRGSVNWNWIINPTQNPLWRSRLALFADERMNLLTAAVATGLKFPMEQYQEARKVNDWLIEAQLQGRPATLTAVIPAMLAEKYVVALAWQSEFVDASRYVKNLAFSVPAQGTYVERIGVGLVADCRNEQLALDFIKFLEEKKNLLAQRRGLLPLSGVSNQTSHFDEWRIFSDDVPRLKELTTALMRVRKEKEGKTAHRGRGGR